MKKIAFRKNLPLIITGVVALGLVAAAAYVKLSHPKSQTTADATPQTSGSGSTSTSTTHPGAGSSGVSPSTPTTSTTSTTPASPPTDPQYNSTTLAKPTGQLLSNHTIRLDGSDATHDSPAESSTCVTVPGATCTIRLTSSDGSVKYVIDAPIQVDANGAATFSWDAKNRGLTAGAWTVVAVASKDGQTAISAADTLTVNP